MRARRQANDENWELDGETIVVTIPMIWKRHGGRKVIIAPDGSDAWTPAKPRPDETLTRALVRAHRWKRLIEDGKYRSAGELAETEGITRSFVNRLLRLTLLAPDIVEAILEGRQPKAMHLEELTDAIPSEWENQRNALFVRGVSAWRQGASRYLQTSVLARSDRSTPVSDTPCKRPFSATSQKRILPTAYP